MSWATAEMSMGVVSVMAFAIQRGGTCMAAALDEILYQRSARRMRAMLEASLWVVGGLALAQLAQGMRDEVLRLSSLPLLLFLALLAGAIWGGWTAGLWRPDWPRATELLAPAQGVS